MQMGKRKKRKARSSKRGSRKGIYILPNLITTAGLFCGFFAIVRATQGQFQDAALFLFIAMLMDGLDGRIARWTNTESDFGKEYDSLADMICFGLTPALVAYEWSLHGIGKLGWLGAFLFVIATALRLARFNTHEVEDKRYFQGLPCPAAAGVVAALVWVAERTEFTGQGLEFIMLIVTIAVALAMVSNIPYRSFKEFDLKGKVSFVALILVVLGVVIIVLEPPLVFFITFSTYFLSGPVIYVFHRRKRTRGDEILGSPIEEEAQELEKRP